MIRKASERRFRHPERSASSRAVEGSRAVFGALTTMARRYYVHVMSSKSGVLYIGSTSDLERRVFAHKQGLIEGFSKKYRVNRLVYVAEFDSASEMVARERQLKGWTRRKKLALIRSQNPAMDDYAGDRGESGRIEEGVASKGGWARGWGREGGAARAARSFDFARPLGGLASLRMTDKGGASAARRLRSG